jgi:hypothetical protein
MEQYFEEISIKMEGFEGFKKEAWSFKVVPTVEKFLSY